MAAAWTTIGLALGLLTRLGSGSRATWLSAMVPWLGASWFWLAATPALAAIARRIRLLQQPWWVRGALHAIPCIIMVLAFSAIMWGLRALVMPTPSSYWVRVFLTCDVGVIQYVGLVVITHAWDRQLDLAQHERRALILEQQLVRARLLYLERQLRPHFLFNCLNAIAEMAHIAPAAAARKIASLRRLLTSALETAGRTEIPLREELATLDAYLDLQRARFLGTIVAEQIASSDVLDVRVPPLLLQPVVENAIQHGLASHARRRSSCHRAPVLQHTTTSTERPSRSASSTRHIIPSFARSRGASSGRKTLKTACRKSSCASSRGAPRSRGGPHSARGSIG